jgi:FkbM family methyltransferase
VEGLLVDSANGLFLVGAEDQQVGRDLVVFGEYGREEIERLLPYITHETSVLVVGGHIGTIVVPLAKRCQALTVVEANPRTFRLLKLNLIINHCQNAQAINVAANDKHEKLRFVLSRTNSGGSKRMPLVHDYMYFADAPEIVEMESAPLDELLLGSRFDVIVMDIEGSEYFALRGMRRLLANARVLALEFTPHHLRNVSGVTVMQFVEEVAPFFRKLFVPTKNVTVHTAQFASVLQGMYDRNESDSGIIFTK